MKPPQIILVLVVVSVVVLFFALDISDYFSLAYLQEQRAKLVEFYSENPVVTILLFALVYIGLTSLSIPSATGLTLLAGAIFDLVTGVIVVSIVSTVGAGLAFLLARYLFRDVVQNKFATQLGPINDGIDRDGIFYLFAIRLVPTIPYFVVNAAMGLTTIKFWSFVWVSQIGMLATTIVFVNAGSQLGQLESLSGILSPTLIVALVLLGIFPLVAKWTVSYLRSRRQRA
ncbi:MAG: VTT domain-containing protein [Gammaproteobacteria bacterium]|nr:VTT domain-containing protein [Gammaproteobacteria bacterium]